MKATYNKPQLHIERFSLTQSIANGCGATHWDDLTGGPQHSSKSSCGWMDSWGDTYWPDENICGEGSQDVVEIEGYCYNNPDGGHNIFSSY